MSNKTCNVSVDEHGSVTVPKEWPGIMLEHPILGIMTFHSVDEILPQWNGARVVVFDHRVVPNNPRHPCTFYTAKNSDASAIALDEIHWELIYIRDLLRQKNIISDENSIIHCKLSNLEFFVFGYKLLIVPIKLASGSS